MRYLAPQLFDCGQLYGFNVLNEPMPPEKTSWAPNQTGPRNADSLTFRTSEHDAAVAGQLITRVTHCGVRENALPLKDAAVHRAEIVPPPIEMVPAGCWKPMLYCAGPALITVIPSALAGVAAAVAAARTANLRIVKPSHRWVCGRDARPGRPGPRLEPAPRHALSIHRP